jgi:hypothetical protein
MAKVILSNGQIYRISTDSDISNHPVNDVHMIVDLPDSDFNSVRLNQKNLTYSNNAFTLLDRSDYFADEASLKIYLQNVIKNIDLFLLNNSSNGMYNNLKTYRNFCESFDATDITFPYDKSWEEYCNDNSITFFHTLQIP